MNSDVLFALLGSAVGGRPAEKLAYSAGMLAELLESAKEHDISHLLAQGLKENGLAYPEEEIIKAVYRFEQLNFEFERLVAALERAEIPFIPLKGAVIRKLYREPWMRSSGDIDILVKGEDFNRAVSFLQDELGYTHNGRSTHDISLYSRGGTHIELHFDLSGSDEEKEVSKVLASVWNYALPREGYNYFYDMTDEFFYFYHVAHMAVHFEFGGCGIRPFIDLFLLDNMENVDLRARDELLGRGGLLSFAQNARMLSRVWLAEGEHTELSRQMQEYLLLGGVYGTSENRVVVARRKQGSRFGYLYSRIFAPGDKLKRYYPILEKHPWLMPVMQVRRWGMLFRPGVAGMAKRELVANKNLDSSHIENTRVLMEEIGL